MTITVTFEEPNIPEDLSATCTALIQLLKDDVSDFTFTTDNGVIVKVTMEVLGVEATRPKESEKAE